MSQPLGNWRCFFWHKWRYYGWITKDVCVREGCGVVREPKDGTKVEARYATTKGAA